MTKLTELEKQWHNLFQEKENFIKSSLGLLYDKNSLCWDKLKNYEECLSDIEKKWHDIRL